MTLDDLEDLNRGDVLHDDHTDLFVLANVDGYVMVRRPNSYPFVVAWDDFKHRDSGEIRLGCGPREKAGAL